MSETMHILCNAIHSHYHYQFNWNNNHPINIEMSIASGWSFTRKLSTYLHYVNAKRFDDRKKNTIFRSHLFFVSKQNTIYWKQKSVEKCFSHFDLVWRQCSQFVFLFCVIFMMRCTFCELFWVVVIRFIFAPFYANVLRWWCCYCIRNNVFFSLLLFILCFV